MADRQPLAGSGFWSPLRNDTTIASLNPTSIEQGIEALLNGHIPLCRHMEMRVTNARDGVYRCTVPLDENNRNPFGGVRGVIQIAAEQAVCAVAGVIHFYSSQLYAAATRININLLKPARSAITAEVIFDDAAAAAAKQRLVDDGQTIIVMHPRVFDEAGTTTAQGEVELLLRSLRPAKGS